MSPDRRQVLAGTAAVAATLALPRAAAAALRPSLWGTREKFKRNLRPMSKWLAVLDRYARESADEPGSCIDFVRDRCRYLEWFGFLDSLRGQAAIAQLGAINAFMNPPKHPYIVDWLNWQVQDYWASPGEFFVNDGDCEDFAIAKFMSIRALAMALDDLRIIQLEDTNLSRADGTTGAVNHAICAAYLDGKVLILDNQIAEVPEAGRIHHYRPVYSLNESGWWRHIPA